MLNAPATQHSLSLKEILTAIDISDIDFFITNKAQLQQFIEENISEMNEVLMAVFDKSAHQLSNEKAILLILHFYELGLDFSGLSITYSLAKKINFLSDKRAPVFLAMHICGLPWFESNEFDGVSSKYQAYTYENAKAAQFREHQKIDKMFFNDYHVTLQTVKDLISDILMVAAQYQMPLSMEQILCFERPSSNLYLDHKPRAKTLDLTGGRPTTSINVFAGKHRTDAVHVPVSDSGASAQSQQDMVSALTPAHFATAPQTAAEPIPDVVIQEFKETQKRARDKEREESRKRQNKLDAIAKVDHPFLSLRESGPALIKQFIQAGDLLALQWLLDEFPSLLSVNGQIFYDQAADLAHADETRYNPIKALIKIKFNLNIVESAKPLIFSAQQPDIKQCIHLKILLPLLVPGKEKLCEKYFKSKFSLEERPQYYNALAQMVEKQPQKKALLEEMRLNLMSDDSTSVVIKKAIS